MTQRQRGQGRRKRQRGFNRRTHRVRGLSRRSRQQRGRGPKWDAIKSFVSQTVIPLVKPLTRRLVKAGISHAPKGIQWASRTLKKKHPKSARRIKTVGNVVAPLLSMAARQL